MTNIPKLSIVVPVYNRVDTLKKCLDSIYFQKYTNFEVIVIDDGSSIDLKSTFDNYPVKYFYLLNNSGPAFARNFGAKQAKGKILVFIDSDVVLTSDFLERLAHIFDKN